MREWNLTISPVLAGCTVERALRRGLGLSSTRIKRAKFRPDGILLDGVRVRTTETVRAGQQLTLRLPEQEMSELVPAPGPVDILYEDPWLLALNKPAGIATHPCSNHYDDTLANRLARVYQERGASLVFRAVNRLDIGTSGVLLVAKTWASQEALQGLLHTDQFIRTYLALTGICPHPDHGVIDQPIGEDPDRQAYRVDPAGKPAVTAYEVLGQRGPYVLLRLRLYTGRTHQIRVHLAALGCPLVGDELYGGEGDLSRPALHSHTVDLVHPFTGEKLHIVAPVPTELKPWMDEQNRKRSVGRGAALR